MGRWLCCSTLRGEYLLHPLRYRAHGCAGVRHYTLLFYLPIPPPQRLSIRFHCPILYWTSPYLHPKQDEFWSPLIRHGERSSRIKMGRIAEERGRYPSRARRMSQTCRKVSLLSKWAAKVKYVGSSHDALRVDPILSYPISLRPPFPSSRLSIIPSHNPHSSLLPQLSPR